MSETTDAPRLSWPVIATLMVICVFLAWAQGFLGALSPHASLLLFGLRSDFFCRVDLDIGSLVASLLYRLDRGNLVVVDSAAYPVCPVEIETVLHADPVGNL
jgi:hypothetical protein